MSYVFSMTYKIKTFSAMALKCFVKLPSWEEPGVLVPKSSANSTFYCLKLVMGHGILRGHFNTTCNTGQCHIYDLTLPYFGLQNDKCTNNFNDLSKRLFNQLKDQTNGGELQQVCLCSTEACNGRSRVEMKNSTVLFLSLISISFSKLIKIF